MIPFFFPIVGMYHQIPVVYFSSCIILSLFWLPWVVKTACQAVILKIIIFVSYSCWLRCLPTWHQQFWPFNRLCSIFCLVCHVWKMVWIFWLRYELESKFIHAVNHNRLWCPSKHNCKRPQDSLCTAGTRNELAQITDLGERDLGKWRNKRESMEDGMRNKFFMGGKAAF